jgi:hypothetical protein
MREIPPGKVTSEVSLLWIDQEVGMPARLAIVAVTPVLFAAASALAEPAAAVPRSAQELQQLLDSAPPNSTIVCDPNQQLTVPVPITISKPLTLKGLCARLPEKLGNSPLLIARSKGVTITGFNLTGNVDSVPQSERAPLIVIAAGEFRVENGRLADSSKDGVMIEAGYLGADAPDIVGGVVRDVVGTNVARDVVSISGSSGTKQKVRNVLVDNVRGHTSSLRGTVEVSDGAEHITVRKVYAQDSVYAIDIQDHGRPGQTDRHVVIEDVYALRCKHAVRTANKALGHAHITLKDITAQECQAPMRITNIDDITITNLRILDQKEGDSPPLSVKNCNGLALRDVTIENTPHAGPAIVIENCDAALVDGVTLRGKTDALTAAVTYRITADKSFAGLRIGNVAAPGVKESGILLQRPNDKGSLSDYVITNNAAKVLDRIKGERAVVANNLP